MLTSLSRSTVASSRGNCESVSAAMVSVSYKLLIQGPNKGYSFFDKLLLLVLLIFEDKGGGEGG